MRAAWIQTQTLAQSVTLSSASRGRCSRISMGSVSAAITTNSEMPLLSVLVAAGKAWQDVSPRPGLHSMVRHAVLHGLTLIGALAQLLVVGSLLHNVDDGVRELQTAQAWGHHNRSWYALTLRCAQMLTCRRCSYQPTEASASGYALGFTASVIS